MRLKFTNNKSILPRFAFLFYANSWGKNLVAGICGDHVGSGEQVDQFDDYKMHHVFFGSMLAQLVVVPTVTVHIERLKVLQQVYPNEFTGLRDCVKHIVRNGHAFIANQLGEFDLCKALTKRGITILGK